MAKTSLSNHTAFVGFDGYIDTLFRIKGNEDSPFFNKMEAFGNYILAKNNSNFSLELFKLTQKIGGNAPIFANALANLDCDVNLIGSLGYPNLNPIFTELSQKCTVSSYAEPGQAYAFEFDNGKMMLYENADLNELDWQKLMQKIEKNKLVSIFEKNEIICLLNWAEIIGMSSILEGLLQNILPKLTLNLPKWTFFDLADCSNRSRKDVLNVLEIIGQFSKYAKVILSLNHNETKTIYSHLFVQNESDFETMGAQIFEKLNLNCLVLHSPTLSMAFTANKIKKCATFFIEKPMISTGAGDHFNAGFCKAILGKMSIEKALFFANAVANKYISEGVSPTTESLFQSLENQNK